MPVEVNRCGLFIQIVMKENDEVYVPKGYFVIFLPITNSTGAGLRELILNELKTLDLKIEDNLLSGLDNGVK